MLKELFDKQAELNKRTGFDAHALRENFDPQYAGQWLNNYLAAMSNELEELRDCTFWKHWCKEAKEGRRFELHDLQNARVEVIDMLFFWIRIPNMEFDHKSVQLCFRQWKCTFIFYWVLGGNDNERLR